MKGVQIVPEKGKSTLDQLTEEIDADPAFQYVVRPVKPDVPLQERPPRKEGAVHSWFLPTELSKRLLEGLEKNFGMYEVVPGAQWINSVPKSALISGDYFGAEVALVAILYGVYGNAVRAQEFMKGIRLGLQEKIYPKDFIKDKSGSRGRESLEATALFALANGIVEGNVVQCGKSMVECERGLRAAEDGLLFEHLEGDNVTIEGNMFAAMAYMYGRYQESAAARCRAVDAALSNKWVAVHPTNKKEHMNDLVIRVAERGKLITNNLKGTLALALFELCCGELERGRSFVRGFYNYADVVRLVDQASDIIRRKDGEVMSPWYSAMCALVSMADAAREEMEKKSCRV